MSERIKQLILECVDFRLDPDSNAYEAQVCPEDLECLAELIVKECMTVAAKQRKPANLNYNPSERFVEDLRQHFGVKE